MRLVAGIAALMLATDFAIERGNKRHAPLLTFTGIPVKEMFFWSQQK